MAKNVPQKDVSPDVAPEEIPAKKSAADEQKDEILNVRDYILPEELDARLSNYADNDPCFADHVRRAHKLSTTLPDARGQEKWKVEVKLYDPDSGEFSKFGAYRWETIPTPDELREENCFGKLRFVIHYWTPYKTVKGMKVRQGIQTVKSKTFDIAPPVLAVQSTGSVPGLNPINLPAPGQIDAFQTACTQIQNMMISAANFQMQTIVNRQEVVNEGIKIGQLQQQVTNMEKQNQELIKLISAMQENTPPPNVSGEQNGAAALMQLLQPYVPGILQKVGLIDPATGTAPIPPKTE